MFYLHVFTNQFGIPYTMCILCRSNQLYNYTCSLVFCCTMFKRKLYTSIYYINCTKVYKHLLPDVTLTPDWTQVNRCVTTPYNNIINKCQNLYNYTIKRIPLKNVKHQSVLTSLQVDRPHQHYKPNNEVFCTQPYWKITLFISLHLSFVFFAIFNTLYLLQCLPMLTRAYLTFLTLVFKIMFISRVYYYQCILYFCLFFVHTYIHKTLNLKKKTCTKALQIRVPRNTSISHTKDLYTVCRSVHIRTCLNIGTHMFRSLCY